MNNTYEPNRKSDAIYKKWTENKYFSAKPNPDKKPFTVVIPPPNITGQLHMGHALNDTLQDAIIRYKRMKGFETLWLPGTDHASIATEVKIVESMRKEGVTKADIGREGFLERAFLWKEKYGGRIVEQLKKLGCSCDWDRLAFTMDEKCSKAVKAAFVSMYRKGLIYRGDRIINMCPGCGTAISDAEVEYKTEEGHLWYIKYPVENSVEFITVATTRPETMLGDTAVAVNPSDERYKSFIGKTLILPINGRKIPVISDFYVDSAFGTGAVKITPAHDPNDYEVGLRHGLEVISVMDERGFMNENAGIYKGLKNSDARQKIAEELKKQGFLVKTEKHEHNVGHCYRCDSVIEPMVSKQWFVKMDELVKPAIEAVKTGEVKFLPERFEKNYFHWMENIRDWCISRQLWWGHRIPVYYCDKCGFTDASEEELKVCPKCGAPLRQDEDVLDTWFSSALWPFSTLGWPDKNADLDYFYPTSLLVTAYDIITFWVSRMIFSGYEHTGKKPFSDVLIHGIVRDALGRKMSKSLGNGIDPLEIIDKYGADTLRMSLVFGVSAGGDIKYSEEKLEGFRNFMNKVWNASRFVLMNTDGFAQKNIEDIKLTLADKWILNELGAVTKTVTDFMDSYEVGLASSALYDFVWSKFCDWYIEMSKTALYTSDLDKRNDTVNVLVYVLRQTLKLLHPIVPFITEEIFDELPNKDAEDIMVSDFPCARFDFAEDAAAMEKVMDTIKAVRNMRSEMNVSQSKRTELYIEPKEGCEEDVKAAALYIEKLAMGSSFNLGRFEGKAVTVMTELCRVTVPMNQLVDAEAEIKRLNKETEIARAELKRAEGKLKNTGFLAKAPQSLIEEEKQKTVKYSELIAKYEAEIQNLKD